MCKMQRLFTPSSILYQTSFLLSSVSLGIVIDIFVRHSVYFIDNCNTGDGYSICQGWEMLLASGVPPMIYITEGIVCLVLVAFITIITIRARRNEVKREDNRDRREILLQQNLVANTKNMRRIIRLLEKQNANRKVNKLPKKNSQL